LKTQEINLLISAPGRSSPQPTARQVGIAVLVLVLSGTIAGLWQEHGRIALERSVQVLNADIDTVIMDLEERSQFLAERDADPARVAELKRRQREADDKSRVLDLLSGESVGNTEGFSGHLAALGRRHPEGLWLENILIADGGRQLMLAGRTLSAGLVPQFLAELRDEPALAGTAFATFTLAGDDHDNAAMRFALATGCPQGNTAADTQSGEACVPLENPVEASFAATEPSQ
jgi:hypothetical protein